MDDLLPSPETVNRLAKELKLPYEQVLDAVLRAFGYGALPEPDAHQCLPACPQ